jgi:hypothetical protein
MPEDCDSALLSELAVSIKPLVQQYNSLTYIDCIQRLPDYRLIEREVKQKGRSCVAAVLYMLGQSYELLAVPMTPQDRFEDLHFLYNSTPLIDTVLRSMAEEASTLYQKLHGARPDFVRIQSVSNNPAFYSEMTEDHRKLYRLCRVLTVVADYRDLFQRDAFLMDHRRYRSVEERPSSCWSGPAIGANHGRVNRRMCRKKSLVKGQHISRQSLHHPPLPAHHILTAGVLSINLNGSDLNRHRKAVLPGIWSSGLSGRTW